VGAAGWDQFALAFGFIGAGVTVAALRHGGAAQPRGAARTGRSGRVVVTVGMVAELTPEA